MNVQKKAIHEAGHAVVAEALGSSVEYVTLDGNENSANAHCAHSVEKVTDTAAILITAGGMAADALAGNKFADGAYKNDYAIIADLAAGLDKPDIPRFIEGSTEIVKKYWPAVQRIAKALVANRTVSGNTVRQIIRTSPTAPAKSVTVAETCPGQTRKTVRQESEPAKHAVIFVSKRYYDAAKAPQEKTMVYGTNYNKTTQPPIRPGVIDKMVRGTNGAMFSHPADANGAYVPPKRWEWEAPQEQPEATKKAKRVVVVCA